MQIKKRILTELPKVYSICKVPFESRHDEPCFVAGSETDGPLLYFEPPDYQPRVIADQPGGYISLWPFERNGDRYLIASTRFWPGFNAADCVITVYPLDGGERPEPVKSFPLSYTHRVAVVEVGGRQTFIASRLCSKKDSREDWSHPAGIYAATIPDSLGEEWNLTPVMEGLNKNHGMDLARIEPGGAEGFLVSAMEGCFFLTIPQDTDQPWPSVRIDSEETSDAYAYDWEGTGRPLVFSI